MQIPIPDDWGGADWTCYNIAWPDSVLWQGLLVGFISQATRGRFWDEKSGSIAAIQSVGREIFERNYPFVDCAGDAADNGLIRVEDCPTCGGGMLIMESEEMGQVVTEVRIEGGKLYVEYGPCCVKEFGLTMNAVTPLVEDEVAADNWPDQQEFSGCGKAGAMIDAIWLVGNECYDEIDNFPWQWVGHVKDDVPGMELSSGYIVMSVLDAQILALAEVSRSEVFSDEAKQSLICGALGQFGDDYDTPADLKSICHGLVQSAYGLDFMRISFFGAVIEAIGDNDLRNAALSGATDLERDCDCPDVIAGPTEPSASGWYWSAEQPSREWDVPNDHSYVYPFNLFPCNHDVYGVLFKLEVLDGAPEAIKRSDVPAPDITYDVEVVNANSDQLAWNTFHAQVQQDVYDELYPSGGPVELSGTGGKHSGDVETPVADHDQLALFTMHMRCVIDETATVRLSGVRWLFNENSDSHS